MIAMALSCSPKLLIADEPTTALDVTTQAQLLELMKEKVTSLHTSLVIVTHNLGVVARYVERIYVMYAGRVVETGPSSEIFARPRHPYTLGLLKSVPRLDQIRKEKLDPIEGVPPDLVRIPPGCSFRPRCRFSVDRCAEETPPLLPVADSHTSACWEWERVAQATKSPAPA